MKYLGPLSSVAGTRLFYVDLINQLNTDELLTSITVTCNNTEVTISDTTIVSTDTTTKDGHILLAKQSIYFRASCIAYITSVVTITIHYSTNANNTDSTLVYLKVVKTIV